MTSIALCRRNIFIGGAVTAAMTALASVSASVSALADEPPEDYAEQTLKLDLFSCDISELAARKAVHPVVYKFAELESEEAQAIAGVLLNAGASRPTRPDTLSQMVDTLDRMDPGPAFDLAYIQHQIDNHKSLLTVQKREAENASHQGVQKTVATVLVPLIASHLNMLHTAHTDLAF
ncbi:DUF4142 domain-containing protein [Martelella soudanensis]|uniref:DUF4142 domain-containing protein n=1 Tax=unclassified Martelella TaxID=2629616 RepID=UPI0015DE3CFC|nr:MULTISPECIES: DUF4142 domain-containing protein [unclassified Martelella]